MAYASARPSAYVMNALARQSVECASTTRFYECVSTKNCNCNILIRDCMAKNAHIFVA